LTSPQSHLRETLAALIVIETPNPDGNFGSSGTEITPDASIDSTFRAKTKNVVHNSPDDDTLEAYNYIVQSGDSLIFLEKRFNVQAGEIRSNEGLPGEGLLNPGQVLQIPKSTDTIPFYPSILPDSEVVFSPSVVDFNIEKYVNEAGGYLSQFEEHVYDEWLTGTQIVERVAVESSVNPRLLLAFLEWRSGWVLGEPVQPRDKRYPIGFRASGKIGLYQELVMTATQLNKGYYEGRAGIVRQLTFQDGSRIQIHPELNAGSIGVQRLFSLFYGRTGWEQALYSPGGFTQLYDEMFPTSWERAELVEPLLPGNLEQPALELPFLQGLRWSLTGGPHYSWNAGSPKGALDFAPVTGELACQVSRAWVTASSPGYLTRSAHNVTVIDLDGDGFEGTGWSILYLHLADKEMISEGQWIEVDQPLGHPSCERGQNTGTHVHISRKYAGEWLPVEGSVPFMLSGWQVFAGEQNYQGGLRKDGTEVVANSSGPRTSVLER